MKKQLICGNWVAFSLFWAGSATALELTSPSFKQGGRIPSQYTCDGQNVSPPLLFQDIPPKTKSLTLIMDDPDAPSDTWDHWIVFNLPVASGGLPENAITLPAEAHFGRNSWNNLGYGGPCPPDREHRYFFKIYALDKVLGLAEGASKAEVEAAMKGHVLAQAELVGKYQRTK